MRSKIVAIFLPFVFVSEYLRLFDGDYSLEIVLIDCQERFEAMTEGGHHADGRC
jgi:hypothetical protein